MKEFYDTSVIVAASWKDHAHHAASVERFRHASRSHSACGLHTLAEVYAVLTAMSVRNRLSPVEVALVIQELRERLKIISLTEQEYVDTIQTSAERGFTSGRIYDALLLACAAKSEAEVVYTWNVKHFQATDPILTAEVRTP